MAPTQVDHADAIGSNQYQSGNRPNVPLAPTQEDHGNCPAFAPTVGITVDLVGKSAAELG
jgi:hypothetical protein